MLIDDLVKYFEDWAPPGAAWEKDNVGLQIGSKAMKAKNIFLCLELNYKALNEAIKKDCNFIFTHHPLIFKPIKSIDFQNSRQAKLIQKLIKNDITVYSAHTNLDNVKDGVSFELANALKLKNIRFILNEQSNQFKIVVFVPIEKTEPVSRAIFNAGGGIIGEYNKCSFRLNGTGTFEGSENSVPAIGSRKTFEHVEEIRLEVLVDSWKLSRVISEIRNSHPYEEPAIDVYPLKNKNVNYGFGAIGELKNNFSVNGFLEYVCNSLKTSNVRYCKGKGNKIKRVAVCGGSGAELINEAILQNADAMVTADIKYHTFQDSENQILCVDAGHYETEIQSLSAVERKLKKFNRIITEKIKIYKFTGTTNPVKFFNN